MTTRHAWIAGAGIAGLASALALSRSGWLVSVAERASMFSEVGAGIQLGPNAVRRLQAWGVADHALLQPVRPDALHARRASDASTLGRLRLGASIATTYGAPYFTVHRADLHAALLAIVREQPGVVLHTDTPVTTTSEGLWSWAGVVEVPQDDLRVMADGVWSHLRNEVVDQGLPRWTGHVAYRALVPMAAMPKTYQRNEVGVWLGPDLHVVHYPVRGGEAFNVVVLLDAPEITPQQNWDQTADALGVSRAVQHTHRELRGLIEAVSAAGGAWRLWALAGRRAVSGPEQLVRGHAALVGDAAHPMLPYLAQGAGMAIEDAQVLADALSTQNAVAVGLQRYADLRWRRVAKVQSRAMRNGQIFHLQGPLAWARDASMRLGGEAVLDVPWLYAG